MTTYCQRCGAMTDPAIRCMKGCDDKDYTKVTDFSDMMSGRKPTQKFYMVFREDSRLPEVKHTNGVDATVEAQRLAKKHPGSKVFILETVDCFLCTVSEPESVDIEE